jgi:splicing factor 1
MEGSVEGSTVQPARKRRNRWDDDPEENSQTKSNNSTVNAKDSSDDVNSGPSTIAPTDSNVAQHDNVEDVKRARKSRWGSAEQAPAPVQPSQPSSLSAPNMITEEILQQTMIMQLQLQQINQKMLTVVADALRIEQDPNRSPSPPPKYDSNGKRTNTREVRMREALMKERTDLIERLIKLNPVYQPPPDYVRVKPFRRLYIPKNTDPMMNYIGLIIGPRGMTQKELESSTGCKISIRGKGSAKEGSKGRASKHDEDDDLHVFVQGEEEEKVALACKKLEEILRPLDDSVNEHKQKQLKQLALINGTLRENEYCPVCGEKGHQQFDCPYRAKAFKAAGVKCSICGDLSHPTRDCPMRKEGPANESVIESEYDNFIAQLSGGGASSSKAKESTEAASTDSAGKTSGGDSGSAPGARVNRATGQTILAPIVDMFAKKQQTVIHVNTVLTGAAPPSFLSTEQNTTTSGEAATTVPSHAASNVAAWMATPAAGTTPAAVPPAVSAPSAVATPMATAYGSYYPYGAYSAYYGYDAATYMAMQQQASAGMGYAMPPPPPPPPTAVSNYGIPPPPPPTTNFPPPPPPPN